MVRVFSAKRGLLSCQKLSKNGPRALFSTSFPKSNNNEDLEKVKILIEQKMAELKRAEQKRIEDEKKPKLSDFTRPIVTTLIIGSITYLSLHWLWWHLEYKEREIVLKEEMKSKEDELAALLQGQDTPKQTAGKKSWFRFWSTN
ncbi:hypothetical protein WICANDRAFT_71151 [Wickerhamomyces anomalus NRRL Y-366-8]|uniref:Inner membrane assembly complex subunit 17 n=1 Tax=Wickerhamomyces anomalus (strain ATCC 58044 / CBS 1984 / NCYC 433 / NRRL Y-366-8) TaxID=683960 RepID=A0A1E3NVN7_WICAA|nr:uncharacterized protein WICANDRAFT_71151 [Wickerhamomyces anomalus NRRL Y-366-8]ODQ57208.1 hypothetical protein WICANDRAFT_71151 [Wickerhamomyces anomalus NRRL Y-366-8]